MAAPAHRRSHLAAPALRCCWGRSQSSHWRAGRGQSRGAGRRTRGGRLQATGRERTESMIRRRATHCGRERAAGWPRSWRSLAGRQKQGQLPNTAPRWPETQTMCTGLLQKDPPAFSTGRKRVDSAPPSPKEPASNRRRGRCSCTMLCFRLVRGPGRRVGQQGWSGA